MSTPVISVVTIFLNPGSFLEEAIESVLSQSYEDWELLLVDDGSTDASTGIARRYAERYPDRIRYLEHPGHVNRGMSASRNLGLQEARGGFVAFLDADDVWLPDRLSTHLRILEEHPEAAMVYGPTRYWYGWTGKPEDEERDFVADMFVPLESIYAPPALLKVFLETGGGALPGICSLLARRAVVEEVGGFESAFRGTYEDQVFLSKVALHAPVYVTGACLDFYRQHPDSCCYQAIETGEYHPMRPHPARERYLDWLERYMAKEGVEDAELWTLLRRELWPYRHPLRYWWREVGPRRAMAVQTRRAARAVLPQAAWSWLREQLRG